MLCKEDLGTHLLIHPVAFLTAWDWWKAWDWVDQGRAAQWEAMAEVNATSADYCHPFHKKGWVAIPLPVNGLVRYPRGSDPTLVVGPLTIDDHGDFVGYLLTAPERFTRVKTSSLALPSLYTTEEMSEPVPIGLLVCREWNDNAALACWHELLSTLQQECDIEDLKGEVEADLDPSD